MCTTKQNLLQIHCDRVCFKTFSELEYRYSTAKPEKTDMCDLVTQLKFSEVRFDLICLELN